MKDKVNTLNMFRSIISSQENDRRQLGVILHESVAQDLYAIRVSLQSYLLEHGSIAQIEEIKKMLNNTISEVQQVANLLLPTVLRDLGFSKAIEDLISQFKTQNLQFKVHIEKDSDNLNFDFQLYIYRLIHELIKVRKIVPEVDFMNLKIKILKDLLLIELIDNGKRDFQTETIGDCNDLKCIKNTVLLYDGAFEVITNKTGTKILITLNINQKYD